MMNKKILSIVSGLGTVVLLGLNYVGTSQLCGGRQHTICMGNLYNVIINLFPIVSLFLVSLIVYKMRDEVFRTWSRFAVVWIPLSMFLVLIAPEYGHAFMPIEKGTVAGFSSLLFVIISVVIIMWKYLTTRSR